MKKVALVFFALVAVAGAFANIAAPTRPPETFGDLFSVEDGENPLRVEHERLTFDLRGADRHKGSGRAVYTIVNPTGTEQRRLFNFVTRDAGNVVVTADGVLVETAKSEIKGDDVPWIDPMNLSQTEFVFPCYSFELAFAPGQTREITVEFDMEGGYDNRAIPMGPEAPAASHLLNMLKDGEWVRWFRYDLSPAATFGGGFGGLELEIILAKGTRLLPGLPLEAVETADRVVYRGRFDALPGPLLDMKVAKSTDYNILGLTLKSGVAIPFDGREVFWDNQLLADLCLSNHMLSAGVQINPFLYCFRGLALYTWFPPGRTGGYGYLGMFDIRAGGGLAVDFLEEFRVGFELHAGMRLGPFALEPSWKLFLPDTDGVWNQELNICYVFSF